MQFELRFLVHEHTFPQDHFGFKILESQSLGLLPNEFIQWYHIVMNHTLWKSIIFIRDSGSLGFMMVDATTEGNQCEAISDWLVISIMSLGELTLYT